MSRPDPAVLDGLRDRIRHLERMGGETSWDASRRTALGVEEIDRALPWGGLPWGALHEIIAEDGDGRSVCGAATGFAVTLLSRLCRDRDGVVLWCRRETGLYGPALARHGLDPHRLIVVHGRTTTEILWAMEEGLRGGLPAAVVGETDGADPTAARRLQLAAETGGVPALLLRPSGGGTPSPAATRWRVSSAPRERSDTPPRWRVTLARCRGGTHPHTWVMTGPGMTA